MARVKTPSYIKEPGGRMGDIVFYSFRGRVYTRLYVIPANPDTEKQRTVRNTFGNAVRSWQNLDTEDKYRYNRKGDRLSLSGYNLYISQYMKMNLSYTDIKISSNIQAPGYASLPDQVSILSVIPIMPLRYSKGKDNIHSINRAFTVQV